MKSPTLYKAVAATVFVLFSLSCALFDNTVLQSGGTPGAASSGDDAAGELEALTDPRVEGALALRSVHMELQSAFPGADAVRTVISIDAAGNQHIVQATPVPDGSNITPESPDWNMFEIFIVGGNAYTRMGKTGSAESIPDEKDALSDILYSPTGPGMWLILLPEDNFIPAGTESVGGFEAEKFTVNGSLDAGAITGEFWVDKETGALVGANLSLAEAILRTAESGAGGWVTIIFTVEKAEVPAITVP